VASITGASVKDGSLTGRDIRDRSLTKKDFRTGKLPGPRGVTVRAVRSGDVRVVKPG
jgi:hypothetical protein